MRFAGLYFLLIVQLDRVPAPLTAITLTVIAPVPELKFLIALSSSY